VTFRSILFPQDTTPPQATEAPAFFIDLNLDQIVDAITAPKEEYALTSYFYTPLLDVDSIYYRHEIMKDLEDAGLLEHIRHFAEQMRTMRKQLAQVDKLYYTLQKHRWFLSAVDVYCAAVTYLTDALGSTHLRSRGFVAFRDYLTAHVATDGFQMLLRHTKALIDDLASIEYSMLVYDNDVKVRQYESEADYSLEVTQTFAKFQQGSVKDYRVAFTESPDMNHVEAAVLEFVARLYADIFARLEAYCTANEHYVDATIRSFDREIQFYVGYLEYVSTLRRAGLKVCYPEISVNKDVYAYDSFDIALAHKLIPEHSAVVCNDFYLKGKERIFVVSGPNQGGKTTFARTFGQLHYLALIGCPVPGKDAQLFLFDNLFTHFEKEETITSLHGKLEDELFRIHDILEKATPRSIVIMNEIFTSTTLRDAIFLGRQVTDSIIRLDLLCVFVTFIDEMASLSDTIVSMVSTTVPDNPAVRTFKVVRKLADGRAYAVTIAEKYRLTYECLKERIRA